MRRKSVVLLLISLYLCLIAGSALWVGQLWTSSKPSIVFAVKGSSTEPLTSSQTPALTTYATLDNSQLPIIYSKEWLLYDVESGRTLAASKNQTAVPIASTTKLMTVYIAERYLQPEDPITISTAAASQSAVSSVMGIHKKEKITAQQLLIGAMLVSGNDASYALAEQVGGILLKDDKATSEQKVARFVEEMNKEAARLHMKDTQYKDPVGINDEGHSAPLDLAKLTSQVIQNKRISQIMGTPKATFASISGYSYDLANSNRLVNEWQYAGIIGGKTGYTDAAGHCLINAATRDGHTLIAVILHTNSQTNEASAIESRKLLDAGFRLTQWQ